MQVCLYSVFTVTYADLLFIEIPKQLAANQRKTMISIWAYDMESDGHFLVLNVLIVIELCTLVQLTPLRI